LVRNSSPSSNREPKQHDAFRRQAPSESVPDKRTRLLNSRARSRSRFNSRPTTEAPTTPPSRTRPRSRLRSSLRTHKTATTTTTRRPTRFRPRTSLQEQRSLNSFSSNRNNRFSSNRNRDSIFGTSSRDNNRNRFSSSQSSRSSFFNRGKQVIDYDDYDYYDYEDTNLQSSQNGVPDFITVTHQVPVATQIPVIEFGKTTFRDILSTSPSLEVVAVTALKSTEISESPIIYANAQTITAQPGVQNILFDALRATETTSITFTPTRIRGRKTSFSHVLPTTIYNVETVTTQIVEPVDQNALLNSLLQNLLLGQNQSPLNPLQKNPLQPNQPVANVQKTPVTNTLTHTSTYVTTITEEDSTVIPITFRGKEITTTLIESSTKVITATEFSTETVVQSVPVPVVAPTPVLPQIAQTQAPAFNPLTNNPQIAELLPALLAVQQNGLLNQQQQQRSQQTTQQQIALLAAQEELRLAQQLQGQQDILQLDSADFNDELLAQINLDDFSDEDLANLNIDAVVDAVTQPKEKNQIHFPRKNLFGSIQDALADVPEKPQPEPASPKSSVITIFKSGSRPGDFTRVFSTIFFDNKRRKRDTLNEIEPSRPQPVVLTDEPNFLESFNGARGPVRAQLTVTDSFIQSSIESLEEKETLSPQSVTKHLESPVLPSVQHP